MSPSHSIIAICPNCQDETIYKGAALRPRITCKKCKTRFYIKMKNDSHDSNHDHGQTIPPRITSPHEEIIEDPNELLMSVAIRELNKPTCDPRWATILLNVLDKSKQLEIKTKTDVMEKYKRMDITTRLELLKSLESRS